MPGNKWPGEGKSLASLWCARNACTCPSPSARKTEQVQYSRRPPGRSSGQRVARKWDWIAANCAISLSRRNQRTSGWRRTMPEAVHGASSKIASNGWPPQCVCHQSCGRPASAASTWACSPKRSSVPRIRSQRSGSTSSAVTCRAASGPAHSSKCAVLPPGAAHASRTRMGRSNASPSRSKGAAIWAAASCTEASPSKKPGRSDTGNARCSTRPLSPMACDSQLIAASACW